MRRNQYSGLITVIHRSTIIKGFLSIFVLLLFIFSVSGILTSLQPKYRLSSESIHSVTHQVSGKMLFTLLANENHYFFKVLPKDERSLGFTRQMLKLSANISLDDPRSLLGRELPGFSIFDSEIIIAGEGTNYTNIPYESAPPEKVLNNKNEAPLQNIDKIKEQTKTDAQPSITTNGRKVVLIYHTHNRESFLPYLKGVTDPNHASHSKINITKLGERMAQDLLDKGIGSSLDKSDVVGRLVSKGLKYPRAYQESRSDVQGAMAQNKDLQYLIDIHRDSRRKNQTTITINGQKYAKIAFVIGRDNANKDKNIALATKIHRGIEKKYPGLSRGVILQGGKGHNGIYNQDMSGNAMLLEVGGVDNTFEEMYLTIDAFADVFADMYWDANEVSKPLDDSEKQ
ncbi:stage II sporulation protein P [Peribacillus sp. SCS-155]|uniref:stage II sporulation protein P n=1 Tax=Peribacillus sedimenti TaxID=3115297 RepID=UPI003906731C